MKKFILPALICTIPSLINLIISYEFSNNQTLFELIAIGDKILVFFILMYFAKKYKLKFYNSVISFGKAFKYLFKISFLWSFTHAILILIFKLLYADLIPNTFAQSVSNKKEEMISTMGSIPANSQKILDSLNLFLSNPYVYSVMTLIGFLFIGIIMSLIISAIVKTKIAD